MIKKEITPPPKGMIGPRVVHLSKQIRKVFNEAVIEQGLFSGQQDILFNIVENEGITLGALAHKLRVATATASVSVKRMEKAGFIVKKEDESDARIIRLYPTQKAKEAPEKIKEHMDSLESVISRNMTNEQVYELSKLLDLAINNMEKECGNID